MKYYLSSYRLGNETEKLIKLVPYKLIGYIPNALDFTNTDIKRKNDHINKDIRVIEQLGLGCELIDLKKYFGRQKELENKIYKLGAIFISGGNVFILRQAMKLSGLDEILKKLKNNEKFLYAGYSAAGCVLSPSLKGYELVDDASELPYKQLKQTIWNGLGFLNYMFLPHFESNNPESSVIEKELEYCKNNNLPYKTLRDGEVIIIE